MSADSVLGPTDPSPRSQSLWMSGARIIATVLAIGIPLVLVRVLTKSEFGYYKQIFLVGHTVQTVLMLGIPASLYFFIPRDRDGAHAFRVQSLWLLVGLGILGGGLVLAAGGAIQSFFSANLRPYIPLLALFVALSIPAALIPALPMVDRRSRLAAQLVVGLNLTRAGLLIAIALLTRNLYWIIAVVCFALGLQLAAAVFYLVRAGRGHPWRPAFGHLREQLAYALPFTGAVTIGEIRQKAHAYYVGWAFTPETFAVYAAATIDIPLISPLRETIEEVVVLENAAHYSAGRRSEVRRVFHRASHLIGLLLIPIWLIAEAFAPELIVLVYGAPYADATPIFRAFLFMLPLSVFLGSPMLRASGDIRVMVAADAIALVASLGVLFGFAGSFGPLAAVASLVAGQAAFMFAAARRTAQRLELGPWQLLPWRKLGAVIAVAGLSAVIAESSADAIGLEGVSKLLLGGSAAAGLYAAGSWLGGLIPESEKEWIRTNLSRLRPSRSVTGGSSPNAGPPRRSPPE